MTGPIPDPYGPPLVDASGNVYGTTATGGYYSVGTAFELMPTSSGYAYNEIFSFGQGNDAEFPYGSLWLTSSGALVGTSIVGGANNAGTVFSLASNGSTYSETLLYSFGKNLATPSGGVIEDASGDFYGTAECRVNINGGGCGGNGGVFRISPSGETELHRFEGGKKEGGKPLNNLVMDASGNLYGVSNGLSSRTYGDVFELSPTPHGEWSETILHAFQGGSDGRCQHSSGCAGLLLAQNGTFYGTTARGGTSGNGLVFALTP